MRTLGPGELLSQLADIKSRGGRIVLMLAGSQPNYLNRDGTFSLSMWKERIDRFRGIDFSSYVKDGTIIGHYLIDEPYDPANYGGQAVTGATIDEMARYSKSIWPGMLTIVRSEPYLIKWSGNYQYLDAAWAQYLARKGDPTDYINKNVSAAKQMGLGLITGLNLTMRRPSAAPRSGLSSSTRASGSAPSFCIRSGTFRMVCFRMSSFLVTSRQVSGTDTGAPGSGRTQKGETISLPDPFWR